MDKVQHTVAWYQQKIGSYDKQLWEQSVEQKVLDGIQQAPRRVVRPKTELIDVDLVRGSTFTKAKPQVPWTYITLKTFSRVLLFPFHYKWWIQQTSFLFWVFLFVLYLLQVLTLCVFFNNVGEELTQDEQSLSEVVIPFILMVVLGLIHSQTILTHLKPPVRDNKRDGWRRKRSLSQNRGSVSNIDVVSNSTNDPVASQSKSSMKGHTGSRPLRERTKERRVRLKPNNQRSNLRSDSRSEQVSQDSESAYHTHEASDSIVDRTSSLDHESNGASGSKKLLDKKLDISPRFLLNGHESKKVSEYNKSNESQESDFPKDSNSEDEKNIVNSEKGEKSKRNSQSISSDNEEDLVENKNVEVAKNGVKDGDIPVDKMVVKGEEKHCDSIENVGASSLEHKIKFEGISVSADVDEKTEGIGIYLTDTVHTLSSVNGNKNEGFDDHMKGVAKGSKDDCKNIVVDLNGEVALDNGKEKLVDDLNIDGASHSVSQSINNSVCSSRNNSDQIKHDISDTIDKKTITDFHSCQTADQSCLKHSVIKQTSGNGVKSLPLKATGSSISDTVNNVHFTADLVQLREITPKSSREGTPTHTQSDMLIQSKRGIVGNKSDTESDSDDNLASKKHLPKVRLWKISQSESETGSILRNRRNPKLSLRETKTNSTTGISSSEAETEGLSSEHSRGSRRNLASSEEWGDHLQSEVDSTTESSSCGSDPEISTHEAPEHESCDETQSNTALNVGMTASNMHAVNLLTSSSASSSHPPDKVTCIIWERNECKKVELTALDIGWAIIETVDKIPESSDYILIGVTFSLLMAAVPFLFEAFHSKDLPSLLSWDILEVIWEWSSNKTWRARLIHTNAAIQRLCLSAILFFLLSVADRTFKQRLLYAKHFCYLTSSRRARKFDLPHLRLNKVRNIRSWLSLRSYLKKRGPQRSVDVIVSSAFLLTLIMLILMCLQLLRDAETYLNYLVNWELLLWSLALGVYLLRFMTLGLRINKKYRNLSVLITEQINLYLQMEQKPHKKEELMVANNVLKLAESLLKELESPFKISGISANPLILNITKVVVLSAFSAVLTELLGFKLKLYKIKLRA
ncbi:homeodomain transcription factor [Mactra antiquata]